MERKFLGNHEWWQTGVIYQIYPRSFMDSNGDGVGDLRGIIARLDYLEWLGVSAVWLSPIYPSPMADFGYDISNYCGIDPLFGSMEDFDQLIEECHRRKLKVILDFVPNHTSAQHPWFLESKQARNHPRREWYIWRDADKNGGVPNNWQSNFGGSAWEWDETTQQFYYHAFLKEQPDLNWRNPEVQSAMHETLKFWLEKGVDGFRVDVIWHIVKDSEFKDNPKNPDFFEGQNPTHELLSTYNADQPEVHEIIRGMRKVIDAFPERMMVGEIYLPVEKLVTYYGEGGEGVHLPFNFQLIVTKWNAKNIAATIEHYEKSLPSYGWPNWVLGNHDNSRIATRIGSAQARIAAMLLLTLRGTPTVYYGDEIGMSDGVIAPSQVRDPFEKNVPGLGLGRDPERTPMQWDFNPNGGFCKQDVLPWLPVHPDHVHRNVTQLSEEPTSILALHRKLLAMRAESASLSIGSYIAYPVIDEVLIFGRYFPGDEAADMFVVVLNFSDIPKHISVLSLLEGASDVIQTIALSTHLDRSDERVEGELSLRGNEGVIVKIQNYILMDRKH